MADEARQQDRAEDNRDPRLVGLEEHHDSANRSAAALLRDRLDRACCAETAPSAAAEAASSAPTATPDPAAPRPACRPGSPARRRTEAPETAAPPAHDRFPRIG